MSVATDSSGGSISDAPELAPFGPGLDADTFKLAFRNHPSGVAVITADAGLGPVAMTATPVFPASVDPALLIFSVSDMSSSSPTIVAAETVVIHLLGAAQLALAKLGATSGIDRFADQSRWSRLATGEPLFAEARTWIRGRIVNRYEAGHSTVIVVQALEAKVLDQDIEDAVDRPLVYHNRTWHGLHDGSQLS